MKTVFESLRMLVFMTLALGLGYTFLVTVISASLFQHKAFGSLIRNDKNEVVGSRLIAQKFENPRYFWPRPSAADFATMPSGASNFGPTSSSLKSEIEKRENALRDSNPNSVFPIPEELIFTSGSGLDPHISPQTAMFQLERVVKARGFNEQQTSKLISLIEKTVENRASWLGDPIINVLLLNIALDQLS